MSAYFTNQERDRIIAAERVHSAWIRQHYKDVVVSGRETIQAGLEYIARQLAGDLQAFKFFLRGVCFHYLSYNAKHFFKSAGKQRARQLLEKVPAAFCCADVMDLLKQMFPHGNYEEDSFKIFFYDRLLETFPEYKVVLSQPVLDNCWIALDKFFSLLFAKIADYDGDIPLLVL